MPSFKSWLRFKSWANQLMFFNPGFLICKRTVLVATLQGNLSIKWDDDVKLALVPGK